MGSMARVNFRRCLELAGTLMPRNFSGVTWFDEATAALRTYQEETMRVTDEVWSLIAALPGLLQENNNICGTFDST